MVGARHNIKPYPLPSEPAGKLNVTDPDSRNLKTTRGWVQGYNAQAVIGEGQIILAAETARRRWEWKHYSYDQPRDLPDRLLAAGFKREPAEALLVAEIADLSLDVPPPGVELRAVVDEQGVDALVSVHNEVFGEDHSALGRSLLADLGQQPTNTVAVVASVGQTPVAGGRVVFHSGTEFASLWGGGTLTAWRGRGVFRSLVAHRAALAAARGFRYLQVDASADSRPILQRLGFVELATTTPFMHDGGGPLASATAPRSASPVEAARSKPA